MKKVLMFGLLAFFGIALFAQDGTGYISILPGYQFSSGDVDSSFVASLDAGYFFNDYWGLHCGVIYNEGKFDFGKQLISKKPTIWWDGKYKDSFYTFEIGPELAKAIGNGQIYWQIVNLGHTFGAEDNQWSYGTAAGYRYHFNDKWGVNCQAAYHRVDDWDTDHWDLRVGLTFKF
jgi:hypothetical protein